MRASIELLQQWRVANHSAITAEKEMLIASLDYLAGKGIEPTDADRERARQKRLAADALFKTTMTQIANVMAFQSVKRGAKREYLAGSTAQGGSQRLL